MELNRRIFWKVRAIPAFTTWLGFSPFSDVPARVTLPLVGL
jgi:hypothetical protein